MDEKKCHDIENKPLSDICLSEDSDDHIQLFELPKRKIIRSPSSAFRRKYQTSKKTCTTRCASCCKVCFSTFSLIFVMLFFAATIISLTVLVVGMSGLKGELDHLKIRLNNAEDAEKDFNVKRDRLQKHFENQLKQVSTYGEKLKNFQVVMTHMKTKLSALNESIVLLNHHPALNLKRIQTDLDKIKTGMADTGSEMLKLQGGHRSLDDRFKKLQSNVKLAQEQLFNNSVDLSRLKNAPLPKRLTTPETFVVTMTADKSSVVRKRDLEKMAHELRKEQIEICENMFGEEIEDLRNRTLSMEQKYSDGFPKSRTLSNNNALNSTEKFLQLHTKYPTSNQAPANTTKN